MIKNDICFIRTNFAKENAYIDEIYGPTKFIELNDFDYTNLKNIFIDMDLNW